MEQIILIYGGRSGEHEVSLRSGAYIFSSLKKAGYEPLPVGITKNGDWYLQNFSEPVDSILPLVEKEESRIGFIPGKGMYTKAGQSLEQLMVFPVIHGTFGEDGTLQGLLEMMDMPYVGADVQSSAVGMDKICSKKLWEKDGLPVVPYCSLTKEKREGKDFSMNRFFSDSRKKLGTPLFIKPSRAGSSVGVSKADTENEFAKAIDTAFCFDREVLIEKAVDAREIECSLMGGEEPSIYGPGEINPTHDFYDYEAKYTDPDGAVLLIPAPVNNNLRERIRKTAVQAYKTLKLNGLARVDLFLDKMTNELYINEVNTMPGFTSISMYPMLCRHEGMTDGEIVKSLVLLGKEEYEKRRALTYALL